MHERRKYSTKERRTFWRLPTLGNIIISRVDSSHAYEGKMFNISEDGMNCASDIPLDLLNLVDIKVVQSTDLPRNNRYTGIVVWRKAASLNHGKYLYGIKFKFAYQKSSQ